MTMYEIMNKYNITESTLKNWKKLGYINDINEIDEQAIKKVIDNKIKTRRNKKSSDFSVINTTYVSDIKTKKLVTKIIEIKEKYNSTLDEVMNVVVTKYVKDKINPEIKQYIDDTFNTFNNEDLINEIDSLDFHYNKNDDFLGCLYMSLISVGEKDTKGIFYTSSKVVDILLNKLTLKNYKYLDPGCGSGNFLIKLFNRLKDKYDEEDIINNLYGYDIDDKAILLAKINIYMLTENTDFNNIKCYKCDYLKDKIDTKFDTIFGNPPWGIKYTISEVKNLTNIYDKVFAKQDSFTQFMLKSFDILNYNGELSFILPSSILNIEKHELIRKVLLNKQITDIMLLGREFNDVVTDVIILKVKNNYNYLSKVNYNNEKVEQTFFNNLPYHNLLLPNVKSLTILDKINNFESYHLTNATYGLGIVTGNNLKYLKNTLLEGYEPIISGKELNKYFVNYEMINNYILFNPSTLQQVANPNLYRSKKKILYKFIGNKLTFSLDTRGLLNLNSANMICLDDSENEYYVLAVLNSRLTNLIYDEYYHANKLLKNHIMSFPIFNISNDLKEEIKNIILNSDDNDYYIEEVEDILYKELKLTDFEIKYLKERY